MAHPLLLIIETIVNLCLHVIDDSSIVPKNRNYWNHVKPHLVDRLLLIAPTQADWNAGCFLLFWRTRHLSIVYTESMVLFSRLKHVI